MMPAHSRAVAPLIATLATMLALVLALLACGGLAHADGNLKAARIYARGKSSFDKRDVNDITSCPKVACLQRLQARYLKSRDSAWHNFVRQLLGPVRVYLFAQFKVGGKSCLQQRPLSNAFGCLAMAIDNLPYVAAKLNIVTVDPKTRRSTNLFAARSHLANVDYYTRAWGAAGFACEGFSQKGNKACRMTSDLTKPISIPFDPSPHLGVSTTTAANAAFHRARSSAKGGVKPLPVFGKGKSGWSESCPEFVRANNAVPLDGPFAPASHEVSKRQIEKELVQSLGEDDPEEIRGRLVYAKIRTAFFNRLALFFAVRTAGAIQKTYSLLRSMEKRKWKRTSPYVKYLKIAAKRPLCAGVAAIPRAIAALSGKQIKSDAAHEAFRRQKDLFIVRQMKELHRLHTLKKQLAALERQYGSHAPKCLYRGDRRCANLGFYKEEIAGILGKNPHFVDLMRAPSFYQRLVKMRDLNLMERELVAPKPAAPKPRVAVVTAVSTARMTKSKNRKARPPAAAPLGGGAIQEFKSLFGDPFGTRRKKDEEEAPVNIREQMQTFWSDYLTSALPHLTNQQVDYIDRACRSPRAFSNENLITNNAFMEAFVTAVPEATWVYCKEYALQRIRHKVDKAQQAFGDFLLKMAGFIPVLGSLADKLLDEFVFKARERESLEQTMKKCRGGLGGCDQVREAREKLSVIDSSGLVSCKRVAGGTKCDFSNTQMAMVALDLVGTFADVGDIFKKVQAVLKSGKAAAHGTMAAKLSTLASVDKGAFLKAAEKAGFDFGLKRIDSLRTPIKAGDARHLHKRAPATTSSLGAGRGLKKAENAGGNFTKGMDKSKVGRVDRFHKAPRSIPTRTEKLTKDAKAALDQVRKAAEHGDSGALMRTLSDMDPETVARIYDRVPKEKLQKLKVTWADRREGLYWASIAQMKRAPPTEIQKMVHRLNAQLPEGKRLDPRVANMADIQAKILDVKNGKIGIELDLARIFGDAPEALGVVRKTVSTATHAAAPGAKAVTDEAKKVANEIIDHTSQEFSFAFREFLRSQGKLRKHTQSASAATKTAIDAAKKAAGKVRKGEDELAAARRAQASIDARALEAQRALEAAGKAGPKKKRLAGLRKAHREASAAEEKAGAIEKRLASVLDRKAIARTELRSARSARKEARRGYREAKAVVEEQQRKLASLEKEAGEAMWRLARTTDELQSTRAALRTAETQKRSKQTVKNLRDKQSALEVRVNEQRAALRAKEEEVTAVADRIGRASNQDTKQAATGLVAALESKTTDLASARSSVKESREQWRKVGKEARAERALLAQVVPKYRKWFSKLETRERKLERKLATARREQALAKERTAQLKKELSPDIVSRAVSPGEARFLGPEGGVKTARETAAALRKEASDLQSRSGFAPGGKTELPKALALAQRKAWIAANEYLRRAAAQASFLQSRRGIIGDRLASLRSALSGGERGIKRVATLEDRLKKARDRVASVEQRLRGAREKAKAPEPKALAGKKLARLEEELAARRAEVQGLESSLDRARAAKSPSLIELRRRDLEDKISALERLDAAAQAKLRPPKETRAARRQAKASGEKLPPLAPSTAAEARKAVIRAERRASALKMRLARKERRAMKAAAKEETARIASLSSARRKVGSELDEAGREMAASEKRVADLKRWNEDMETRVKRANAGARAAEAHLSQVARPKLAQAIAQEQAARRELQGAEMHLRHLETRRTVMKGELSRTPASTREAARASAQERLQRLENEIEEAKRQLTRAKQNEERAKTTTRAAEREVATTESTLRMHKEQAHVFGERGRQIRESKLPAAKAAVDPAKQRVERLGNDQFRRTGSLEEARGRLSATHPDRSGVRERASGHEKGPALDYRKQIVDKFSKSKKFAKIAMQPNPAIKDSMTTSSPAKPPRRPIVQRRYVASVIRDVEAEDDRGKAAFPVRRGTPVLVILESTSPKTQEVMLKVSVLRGQRRGIGWIPKSAVRRR